MSETKALVCGLYHNPATLEYALCHLRNVGFLDANFSVLFPDRSQQLQAQEEEKGLSQNIFESLAQTVVSEILLSVRCESSGQAVVAKKILECTEADSVVSSLESSGEGMSGSGNLA
jgi:hypothetical protein